MPKVQAIAPTAEQPQHCQLAMFSSTFIFAKKQFDDEFHRLDADIAAMAMAKARRKNCPLKVAFMGFAFR